MISQELLEVLACPKCHTRIEFREPDTLRCPNCKVLYPIVYGGRPRFGFERWIRYWLDRRGLWTLRRCGALKQPRLWRPNAGRSQSCSEI